MNPTMSSSEGSASKRPELFWLTGGLAISREFHGTAWPAILRAGVGCVVDVRDELTGGREDAEAAGLKYLRAPLKEGEAPSAGSLRLLTDWIAGRMREGEAVLVVSGKGRGRSAMVACAALVKLGVPLPNALSLLRLARVETDFSADQEHALSQFADDVQERP